MKHIATILIMFSLCGAAWASAVRDAQKEMGIVDAGWKVIKDEGQTVSWLAEPGVVISLMIHPGYDKNLPLQESKEELYSYYRNEALGYSGGIVEVVPRQKSGVGFNLVTMKFRLRDMSDKMRDSPGWAYQINAVLPTHDRTYVVQVAAIEQGTTGTREAGVTVVGMAKEDFKDPADFMKNFRRDPYDRKYDDKALYMISDDRQWDDDFPNHPLTKVRAYIEKIVQGWMLSPAICAGALYKTSVSNHPAEPISPSRAGSP